MDVKMTKNNTFLIFVILLIIGSLIYFQQPKVENDGENQVSNGELKREIPLEVNSGETFEVTYLTDKIGKWGVIIVDSVSGGCKFPAGIEYQSVMLSNGFNSQIVEVTAPSSGSCTFSGDYNFGSDPIKDFPDQTVNIK